jgi:hypothetical protein
MLQLRRSLDLSQEALGAECGGEVGMEDLYRDVAVVAEVVRQVDGRHSANADLAFDAIAIGE